MEALLLSMIKNYELLKVRKEPIWGWGHFGTGANVGWGQFGANLGPMRDGANLGFGPMWFGPIWSGPMWSGPICPGPIWQDTEIRST